MKNYRQHWREPVKISKKTKFKVYLTQFFFLLCLTVLYIQKPTLNFSFPIRNSAIVTPKVSLPRGAKTARDKRM